VWWLRDDGDLALAWTKTEDGALYPRDADGEPDATPTGQEAGKMKRCLLKLNEGPVREITNVIFLGLTLSWLRQ
jgi:hypothetical protein